MGRDDVLDMPPAEVEEILRLRYGVTADAIDVVSGEIATVCRVASGPRLLAFKAIPVPDDDAAGLVRWQTSAMIELARQGLPVPTVQLDVDGRVLAELPVSVGLVLIQVSEWLTDPPLVDVPVDPLLLRAVGEMAARVHLALSEFSPPPAPTRHPWELIRTAETVRGLLDQVHEPRLAALALAAAEIFDRDLAPLLARLPWTVLHHDLHDSNLLIGTGPDGRRVVSGILDFGDLTYGPRLAELAIAAAYGARNCTDPQSAVLEDQRPAGRRQSRSRPMRPSACCLGSSPGSPPTSPSGRRACPALAPSTRGTGWPAPRPRRSPSSCARTQRSSVARVARARH